MRTFSARALACAITVFSLDGCGQKPPVVAPNKLTIDIDCALAGAAEFKRECKLDRVELTQLVVYHPDGAFRRIDVDADGMLTAADGAETVAGQPRAGGGIELKVGLDRYRLPPRKG